MYTWIANRNKPWRAPNGFRGINTAEHPRHPSAELKLSAIKACFEDGNDVQLVSCQGRDAPRIMLHVKDFSDILKVQMENEQKKLQDSVRWSMEVETLRHDLKNHLFCISEYIKSQKQQEALHYIEQITGKLQKDIPHHILTDHPAVNAILDLKRMECEEHLIHLKCFIMEKMPDFNEVDLCVVLSNLLDNAIEAEKKEQKKEIRLSISIVGNYLHITIQNMISESVLQNNKTLKTSKSNAKLHGFGIQSVTDTVQKHDGMMDFYEEASFCLVVPVLLFAYCPFVDWLH